VSQGGTSHPNYPSSCGGGFDATLASGGVDVTSSLSSALGQLITTDPLVCLGSSYGPGGAYPHSDMWGHYGWADPCQALLGHEGYNVIVADVSILLDGVQYNKCTLPGSLMRTNGGTCFDLTQCDVMLPPPLPPPPSPPSPPVPPPAPPPPPATTFYITGPRPQIVFGSNDDCTLELAPGTASITSTCPIDSPSSRRLDETTNDVDRVTQLETRVGQLEMQLQSLTTELKMLKEQRNAP
jgi:hypothetical protein